jgi:glycyl-tRNA synthetase beta chain
LHLDFLIEVGCEEIPARYIEPILEQLTQRLQSTLSEHALSFGNLEAFASPRRLVLHISGLSPAQPDRTELVTGPPVTAGFDLEQRPTRAAEGFARKFGVTSAELIRIGTERGEYLAYENRVLGKSAREILSREIPILFAGLELPKNMRWNSSQFMFIRPIRWILCLLGGEVLDIELAEVKSGDRTHGHRVLCGNIEVKVKDFHNYQELLLENKVHFDPLDRRTRIEGMLLSAATSAGGKLISDPELLRTVVYLNEHPTVVCGNFDPAFLNLPREVLITVMREHQKYFSLLDAEGRLLARFLAVVDSEAAYHPMILRGHERVLQARLADASFFWEQDRKHSLESRVELLKHIVFQAKLGNVYEKTVRLSQLSQFLARMIKHRELVEDIVVAARLAKTDLTSDMVREFTNLQGIMGGLYARAERLSEDVANAIYDHYRPGSLDDDSPRNLVGSILSIADKLDSVVAAFSIGFLPTGSKDPLALRRQTIGLIKVILDQGLSISIKRLAQKSFALLRKLSSRSLEETSRDFEAFFRERLRFVLREKGYRFDEINAIIETGGDDPLDCLERLKAIAGMRGSEDFNSLATSFKRIKNIITKAGISLTGSFPVNPDLFQQEEEKFLYSSVEKIRPKILRLRRRHQYLRVFQLMAALRPQVDLFFDKVLVMAEDPDLQRNRLGIIGSLLQVFLGVADISEIVVN